MALASLGLGYGLPLLVAGRVTGQVLPAVLGIALSLVAAWRGSTVDLLVDGDSLRVRNRWRSKSFPLSTRPRLCATTTTWMMISGAGWVDLQGVQLPGRVFSFPALATMGVNPERNDHLAALAADLEKGATSG